MAQHPGHLERALNQKITELHNRISYLRERGDENSSSEIRRLDDRIGHLMLLIAETRGKNIAIPEQRIAIPPQTVPHQLLLYPDEKDILNEARKKHRLDYDQPEPLPIYSNQMPRISYNPNTMVKPILQLPKRLIPEPVTESQAQRISARIHAKRTGDNRPPPLWVQQMDNLKHSKKARLERIIRRGKS